MRMFRTTRPGPMASFAFVRPGNPFLLIAMGDAGYADALPEEIAKTGKLVLGPWGRIEGEVRIGRQPAPEQQVEFQPAPFERGGRSYVFVNGYTTLTDQRGRFTFDRVVPGPGIARRYVTNSAAPLGLPAWGWQEPVDVKPNQTVRVQIGGKGRPVFGRVVIDGNPRSARGLDEKPARGDRATGRRAEKILLAGVDSALLHRQGRPVPSRGCPAGVYLRARSHRGRRFVPCGFGSGRRWPGKDARHRSRGAGRPARRPARPGNDHRRAFRHGSRSAKGHPNLPYLGLAAKAEAINSGSTITAAGSSSSIFGPRGADPTFSKCPRSRTLRKLSAATRGSS